MFSKVSKYFSRLDIKLTVYYTSIIIVLMAVFTGFFIYRVERSLLKQVDKILRDEGNELVQEIKDAELILLRVAGIYEQDIVHRKHFPIVFRVVSWSGEVIYASKGIENISLPSLKEQTKTFYTVNTSLSTYPLADL